jgi:hypothetical protein
MSISGRQRQDKIQAVCNNGSTPEAEGKPTNFAALLTWACYGLPGWTRLLLSGPLRAQTSSMRPHSSRHGSKKR